MAKAGLIINNIPVNLFDNVVSEVKLYFSQVQDVSKNFDEWCNDLCLNDSKDTLMIMSFAEVEYAAMQTILSGLIKRLFELFPDAPINGEYNLFDPSCGMEVHPFGKEKQVHQVAVSDNDQSEGMRLQDYLDRMSADELEEFLATIAEEEKQLRKFLEKFDNNQLCAIADYMNDTFNMPADNMDVIEFIVTLYKCKQADFYFYEDIQEFFEDINNFMLECGDSI